MNTIKTNLGRFEANVLDRHANGAASLITLSRPYLLDTPYGTLIPQYLPWEDGRRYESVISLYANGNVKFMTLQHQTPVDTPAGAIKAEGLFFHEDGTLKRVFPRYGKLSGYWTEANEYALAEALPVRLPDGETLTVKLLGLAFYPSGKLRSLTLWPQERGTIRTPVGRASVRIGVSYYESGKLRSFEPAEPLAVTTPIGRLKAHDPMPTGINGDVNSLLFAEDGAVTSLTTAEHGIEVSFAWGETRIFEPDTRPGLCSDLVRDPVPLRLGFHAGYVIICTREIYTFDLKNNRFKVLDHHPSPSVRTGRLTWAAEDGCC